MKNAYLLWIIRLLALTALALPLMWGSAQAETQGALPVTHGSIIRNYARITFEWPEPVNFNAEADGKILKISFDRKANPDFGALLGSLYPYITSAERKSDGRTIVLKLDKPYKIRTFLADNISGIDLLGIAPKAENMERLAPSAGQDSATGSTNSVQTTASAVATEPAKPQTIPETTASTVATNPTTASPPPAETPNHSIKVSVSAADDNATLRFSFSERTAIAAFIRNNYLWVVLNKAMPLNLTEFEKLPKTVIGKPELLSGKATVLRIPVDYNIDVSVAKEENSYEWAVLLTQTRRAPSNPLKVEINTDPPAPANVFIPSLQMGDPVTLRDPLVGDELIVTPLFNVGEGIPFVREFIEFNLLKTGQGIALAKKADDVAVQPLRNGLRISLPQGATLTPGLPEVSSSDAAPMETTATFFPYDKWKMLPDVPRYTQIQALFQGIVESPDPQEANEQRLRLAQMYLADGFAPEAIGLLDGINRTNPVFYRTGKVAALHGAANFLLNRFKEASKDFGRSELDNNKEMDYWRKMLSDLNGAPAKYDFLEMNQDYISKYPPVFRQRLAIVAADHSIDMKEYNTAIKIFDTLQQDKILEPIGTYVNYLLAKVATETGQIDDGLASWTRLSADSDHPFVQARAQFSHIIWQMNHGGLTKQAAADQLERLRLAWHGDSLELKILSILGDIYTEQKDYVSAMRVWDDGINSFPGSDTAIEMGHHMEETFLLMFNEGTADNLPTLDALSLYYQYRNYAPQDATGKAILNHLTDRLIGLDLLDQAANLLKHQMLYEAEKTQRSQLGAKIAGIYLLNHQPKNALKTLEDSVYGENPLALRYQRNRLAAESLYEMGQTEKAWIILGQDDSAEAQQIRLDISWEKKDWPHVISIVESMLKARKDTSAPISVDESDYIIKLALAYIFHNDPTQLKYLHDYFDPLMANNPNKDVFEFLTASDIKPDPANFSDVIKNLSVTKSFIGNYHISTETADNQTPTPASKSAAPAKK